MHWRSIVRWSSCLALSVLAACGPAPSAPTASNQAPPADTITNAPSVPAPSGALPDEFLSLMNVGRNHLEQGESALALAAYAKAAALVPNDLDVHLNLANAHLAADAPREAAREADEALRIAPNAADAHFIRGSALLRLGEAAEAVKSLENCRQLDPGEVATRFQLGRARMELRQWTEAIAAFREGLALDPNRLHAPVHYLLGQSLLRAGREAEAQVELEQHQQGLESTGPSVTVALFERGKFTLPRVPFRLEQPDAQGIPVTFTDATAATLGTAASSLSGPVGLVSLDPAGPCHLLVLDRSRGFQLLWNTQGVFSPRGPALPALPNARYHTTLVGDLQNDRAPEVVVLGEAGSHLFRIAPNGTLSDLSTASRIASIKARDGLLMDVDFTGKLDLLALDATTGALRVHRQSGPLLFAEVTGPTVITNPPAGARGLLLEDWNLDGPGDLILAMEQGPPILLEKQRGGPLVPSRPPSWSTATAVATGDFDNDLRPDLAVADAGAGTLALCLHGGQRRTLVPSGATGIRRLVPIDVDNDGWLDLCAAGESPRLWRNLGLAGFREITANAGLANWSAGPIEGIHAADFDGDCDLDWIVTLAGGGLRYLRNDGGHANGLLKVQLSGNRSNAGGIGCKVEIAAGGLRLIRTVHRTPVEIGVGKHQRLDSFLVHWFNWPQGSVDAPVDCREPLLAVEAILQEGSCPYLYAWDGSRFRFVTDILGAAPLGLPIAQGRYIDADPVEMIRIGDEQSFQPRNGRYEIAITEELREVLYLDEASLLVVDHPPDVEVHPTDKLLPSPPFPEGTLVTLHREHPLVHAAAEGGRDVTEVLRAEDGRRVSPPRLRTPQLRGLAEPHSLTLDFGPLDPGTAFTLVLNGWLRFGGGMANIAASHDPSLPFPFPALEVETTPGTWLPLAVTVGAPAGKTKSIVVELPSPLPQGARRLRLSQAFEIHWDRIALLERHPTPPTRITRLQPTTAHLQFHGFGQLENLPPDCPPTPSYDRADPVSRWTILPGGWCTRYGDVLDLVRSRDEGLALIHSGDEIRLGFEASSLPPRLPGTVREFFLHADGWDKDSDFHVATGTQVEPLPFHGMDAQQYGHQPRPPFPTDRLHQELNTRWIEARALKPLAGR